MTPKNPSSNDQFSVRWVDSGRETPVGPNPNFPEGRDFDVSRGADQACALELPYPAPRVGTFVIECKKCGLAIGFTTAGRVDDPRSVRFACKPRLH